MRRTLQLVAVVLGFSLIAAACGDSDPVATTTTGTGVDATTTVPVDEIVVPTGVGAFGNLFSDAEESSDGAASDTLGADDDIVSADCVDDCDDDVPPTATTAPFVPEPQHRAYCATLADIEQRPAPDFETADGLEVVIVWINELAEVAEPDVRPIVYRLADGLRLYADIDDEDFDEGTVATFESDAEAMEDYTDWACFGRGSFELPAPPDPKVVRYCDSFRLLLVELLGTDDPAVQLDAALIWMDNIAADVPEQIRADFDLMHSWYDETAPLYDPAEFFGFEDELAPAAVTEAADRFGEWSDDTCDP